MTAYCLPFVQLAIYAGTQGSPTARNPSAFRLARIQPDPITTLLVMIRELLPDVLLPTSGLVLPSTS